MKAASKSDGEPTPSEPDQETDDDVSVDSLPGIEDAGSDTEPLELDDVFHVLQNERRRNVLRYLDDVDDVIEMRDMAVQIAAWENDTTVQRLHSDQRQRVYIALYQSHLPKLDDLGLIDYNKPRGYVEPRPRLDRVQRYLNPEPSTESAPAATAATSAENERRETFLKTAGGAGLLVAAGWAGLLTPLLSGLSVATVVLAIFVGTVAYAYRSELVPSSAEN
ncbi:hypothetical protein DJ82_04210 [Halorubrum sp. Ib24]|uniref:DUF7344 domain-containing protein n=1 Tax=Halorubrum sp. Ib24 TaxID=1383850 RepID=UPI000B98E3E9|nr:hypothetical protein [Halorubrum sp. Ib24]OYR41834.1 hypothetical protein DJ82_04210 [Halorubrum sp. Ib24]